MTRDIVVYSLTFFKDVAMAINARDKFRAEHGLSTVKDGGAKCQ